MDFRRDYAWLALAGYLCLAIAVPALTPAPEQDFTLPPIAPLVLADNFADEAMMLPLRMQASAALNELQMAATRKIASAN